MPRANEMPRAQREGPPRTDGGLPTIKMDRCHSLHSPLQKGNVDDHAIIDNQDAAHHDGPHRKAARAHQVNERRHRLRRARRLATGRARQEEERCLQQLLDEHANRARLATARRSQRHLVEHAAHARQEAAATCDLMAELDGLMAECCRDMAALPAEMAATTALLSTVSGSANAADNRWREVTASLVTAALMSAATFDDDRHCHEGPATAAALAAQASMAAYKMLDGGSTHPFHGGLPHPPRKRARGRRTRPRVCRQHGP
jgi:hypothetical protein